MHICTGTRRGRRHWLEVAQMLVGEGSVHLLAYGHLTPTRKVRDADPPGPGVCPGRVALRSTGGYVSVGGGLPHPVCDPG